MKVIVFGATGMIGQGVMMECVDSPDVESILAVGRAPSGVSHAKVRDLVRKDLFDYAGCEAELAGYDACFFCLGVSSAGMSEADYTRVTYELTMAAARALVKISPEMTFIYVSGASTDSTEKGSSMWARVKGRTENALLALGFRRAFMFRPGYIQPMRGIKSRTTSYRVLYAVMSPLYPVWKAVLPKIVTTTEKVGRAMLKVAKDGYEKRILEVVDINAAAG